MNPFRKAPEESQESREERFMSDSIGYLYGIHEEAKKQTAFLEKIAQAFSEE